LGVIPSPTLRTLGTGATGATAASALAGLAGGGPKCAGVRNLWAGRPAREFRKLRPDEEKFFRLGKEAYITYTHAYLTEPSR